MIASKRILLLALLVANVSSSFHRSRRGWFRRDLEAVNTAKGIIDSNAFVGTHLRGGSSEAAAAVTDTSGTELNATSRKIPAWKQALPEPLRSKGPKTLQLIQLGMVDIFLLGTAHVSNDSSAETDALLNATEPDCIFVELCDARLALLEGTNESSSSSPSPADDDSSTNKTTSFWQKVKETQEGQSGSRLQALSTVLLTSVQEDYATELGVELGGEFRCAHRYWIRQPQTRRPHLILGDRPLHLTLVRAWESLWWWAKFKVIAALLWSSWQKPNKEEIRRWLDSVMKEETDVLTESFQELRKHFPTLYATIVSERDAYLAAKLFQTCRALSSLAIQQQTGRKKLVCIVGAGHVPGICNWLTNSTDTRSPEQILADLVVTRKWANDPVVQNEAIPMWVTQVTELSDPVQG